MSYHSHTLRNNLKAILIRLDSVQSLLSAELSWLDEVATEMEYLAQLKDRKDKLEEALKEANEREEALVHKNQALEDEKSSLLEQLQSAQAQVARVVSERKEIESILQCESEEEKLGSDQAETVTVDNEEIKPTLPERYDSKWDGTKDWILAHVGRRIIYKRVDFYGYLGMNEERYLYPPRDEWMVCTGGDPARGGDESNCYSPASIERLELYPGETTALRPIQREVGDDLSFLEQYIGQEIEIKNNNGERVLLGKLVTVENHILGFADGHSYRDHLKEGFARYCIGRCDTVNVLRPKEPNGQDPEMP